MSRVSAHVTVLAVRMESAHSRASAQAMWAKVIWQAPIKFIHDYNVNDDDGDVDDVDPFSDSDE